jgi:hypothetical protein
MRLEYRFDNLDALRRAYDPALVNQAARSTIRDLQGKAATIVSRSVREKYNVSASAVKSALKNSKVIEQDGAPAGYLIYLSKRISLSYFATAARPKVKTTRGVRYGARAKLYKRERATIVKGGFFGTAKTSGSAQIFQRTGDARLPIRKLTAPSISQMVGGGEPLQALDKLVREEGDTKFAQNLEYFMQKQMGLR